MVTAQIVSASTRTQGVFNAVFSTDIKPPKHRTRFQPRGAAATSSIRGALKQHLKLLLGIGNETFVFGETRAVTSKGKSFRSHFGTCPTVEELRQPTATDHAAQITREMTSHLWSSLPTWCSSTGTKTVIKILAEVLNDLLTEFITWSYAGLYCEGVAVHLTFWVEHLFCRLAQKALCCVEKDAAAEITPVEKRRWLDLAFARLGALRVEELFEIIVDWDVTRSAIQDLRLFTTNPVTRGYLTHEFANVLQTRLLHPGASTIEILSLYISIIRSFRILDPKGVLLERVARKVRRYLREREDTVKVIVSGLLADTTADQLNQAPPTDSDVLKDLSLELHRHNDQEDCHDDNEFDWNNMDWMPDPIDAAPDYLKSNKNTDVIGSLITLFETKDVFVKELQATLAERLLKRKENFQQEFSVLEHLKLRFGDSALQGCEVMLRDILDSRKVDHIIRKDINQAENPKQGEDEESKPEIHAKILSRLFWPSVPEQSFRVPQEILERQELYERGFEALKQSRKLTWLNAIGQVEVELQLEDRTFHEEVLPWQAVVIHAFQESSDDSKQPAKKALADLAAQLEMSPTLVRSACIFWVSKRVLIESSPGTFTVLEKLSAGKDGDMAMTGDQSALSQTDAAAAVAAEAAAQAAAREAEEEDRKQKMAMYNQFIVSMLTNQGAMPLARIAMMLGIVVPGGFPFSNEELKDFLGSMVKDGALEVGNAGVYKVAS
jgi:anaphase-promoting complex subunit 2